MPNFGVAKKFCARRKLICLAINKSQHWIRVKNFQNFLIKIGSSKLKEVNFSIFLLQTPPSRLGVIDEIDQFCICVSGVWGAMSCVSSDNCFIVVYNKDDGFWMWHMFACLLSLTKPIYVLRTFLLQRGLKSEGHKKESHSYRHMPSLSHSPATLWGRTERATRCKKVSFQR